MKRQCAWCGKGLGPVALPTNKGGEEISHGICSMCEFHMKASSATMELNDYIEDFPHPIVITGNDRVILNANRVARVALGKDNVPVQKLPAGKVFECKNAFLPGGCGKTVHCGTCNLRKVIMDTFNFEKQYQDEQIIIEQAPDDSSRALKMSVSSLKIDGVVYLKIRFI
ncbi:MAG: hypothetical protein A2381_09225 [Bdellovibrionales bacterium RIFOXYB1_FULL_37_110]|nr:MAG: hypothetical protein A2181_06000 [Bdellovibrionales bacterium RIFOXYA1_FULL_38_20]OFZ49266.1 MAG: hypothetical protein A2417_17175 [Bdellovibrionales bacterium RIFOXYC1_FULL_37_79]OFZ58271.1 MAG: hypothetical protein A2381_09225 [Bdellovibrionales bacterium RIFOXYB1_FULL_37_110]OFZ61527.1 MAG: hypothetical protein A2577_00455 [Bdellovibrionales bacterium RIFOXYD1_FULL_36_51]OFZ65354.1 MAG: hypothetical protein A2328_05670 [Bdellovibrionales bacterium RIFOXYB2_FULL_36_6]